MFDEKSRYRDVKEYEVTDHRGRTVKVVAVPVASRQELLGLHLRRQGQRLDHLADRYLDDPAGCWRICELEDVILPESLSEALEVAIPRRSS